MLFNDTVYYNIAYGRENHTATEAEVHEAARRAAIHDPVMAMTDGGVQTSERSRFDSRRSNAVTLTSGFYRRRFTV